MKNSRRFMKARRPLPNPHTMNRSWEITGRTDQAALRANLVAMTRRSRPVRVVGHVVSPGNSGSLKPGMEEIALDLLRVPTVEQGLGDAADRYRGFGRLAMDSFG